MSGGLTPCNCTYVIIECEIGIKNREKYKSIKVSDSV